MIPVLYTRDEKRFITNGIGRLSDCIRCVVTEERNGIYECEFDYPLTGAHYDDIQIGRIIACTHDDRHDIQPFIIYARSVPDLKGIVTFNAHHISYRLSDTVVMPFTAGSCAAALEGVRVNSANVNPFTFWTDKETIGTYALDVPKLARNMLAGEQGSILDVYGAGEYEFDKFTVKLHLHRGQDSGVEIRYGKNLTQLSHKIDESGSYNAIVPYWADNEGNLVTLPEKMIIYEGAIKQTAYLTDHNLIIIRTETNEPIEVKYSVIDAAPYDMSADFSEQPTVAQLRAAAEARFERGDAWLPNENITVNFVQLWQTEEYKEYAALQRVRLCDTVSVYYPAAGISAVKQKVVRVKYNVLLDRYDEIELGDLQSSLGQAIKANIMEDVPTSSMMEAAIQYATDLIRGGLGGYVVMTPGPNGYPQEILIMDSPDVNTAINVWRFNQGGLGHSSNGYQGPFDDIALTQDGRINASMITTGIINADLIRAGIISDESGRNSWDLAAGLLKTKQGEIGPFVIDSSGLERRRTYNLFAVYSNSLISAKSTSYDTGKYFASSVAIDGVHLEFNYKKDSRDIDDIDNLFYFDIQPDTSGYPCLEFRTPYEYPDNHMYYMYDPTRTSVAPIQVIEDVRMSNLEVAGTKSRVVETGNYNDRLLYCYETPSPLFGDIGEAVIDEDGLCYVDIDDIFSETIAEKIEYQVFLQKEGEGDCWIAEKSCRYFVIQGTPELKVAWELKAKQKGYELTRLEQPDRLLDEYAYSKSPATLESYIDEQEELLYGSY